MFQNRLSPHKVQSWNDGHEILIDGHEIFMKYSYNAYSEMMEIQL